MKKILLPAFVALTAVAVPVCSLTAKTAAKGSAQPTVMKVNGKEVKLDEFNYLYNKNNAQQAQPTPIDQYVDMFAVYKLKVADAEAARIDTTAQFRQEFERYRDELARPYLTKQEVVDSLVDEMYSHFKTERDVNYIMLFGGRSDAERQQARQLIDSIRTAIIGGADFAQLADQYSVDKNHGHMGFMAANRYPYAFEQAVYAQPIGELSEVQELPFGYFLVRVDSERPASGQVHARHILKLTRGLDEAGKAAKRAEIDSIYTLLTQGADFAELARTESDDPGSARQGGDLNWFGRGQMVKEFEDAAFGLGSMQISQPVETAYGYHIIQKIDSRSITPYDEARPAILEAMTRDDRSEMPRQARMRELRAEYKAKVNDKELRKVRAIFDGMTAPDSVFIASLKANKAVIATVGKQKITAGEVAAKTTFMREGDGAQNYARFDKALQSAIDDAVVSCTVADLPAKHPEYRDLVNEYRDGMLLFEISNQRVWDRATKDKEGLEAYFQAHRDRYSWDRPRYRGEVIFAANDSVGALAREYVEGKTLDHDALVKEMRSKFGNKVKVERVLAPKGDNAIVDYLVFDGPQAKGTQHWPYFFAYGGKVIDQPTEAADVRGQVATDYQQELEEAWIKELRSKYPVEIYREVIQQVK